MFVAAFLLSKQVTLWIKNSNFIPGIVLNIKLFVFVRDQMLLRYIVEISICFRFFLILSQLKIYYPDIHVC
jgi:hypothetical protein